MIYTAAFTIVWCIFAFGVFNLNMSGKGIIMYILGITSLEVVLYHCIHEYLPASMSWVIIIFILCIYFSVRFHLKIADLIVQSSVAAAIDVLIVILSSLFISVFTVTGIITLIPVSDILVLVLSIPFAILFRNLKLFQRFCEYCRHINSRVATALSIMILAGCCIWALPYQENLLFFYGFLVLIFGICVYVFVSTAKDTIQNKTAQEQLRAKEKELLAAEEKLKEDKAALSQEVHRSSGYIPALKRQLEMQNAETAGELPALKEEVERVKREQQAENRRHVQSTKILPPTGLKLLDLLLKDTTEQCARQDIDFDITVMTPINMLVELDLITETALLRLFGDLLKNAVKAVGKNEPGKRKILVIMGISFEHYQIEFFDNGPPFAKKVLHNFGKRGVTTDGSGHGLADTLEALKPSGGSIVIVEDENDREYTKAIRIIFDALNRVEVCSSRI